MVESSITQVSAISAQRGPREVVADFMRLTVDTPDLKKAKLHLTKRSVESGRFEAGAVPVGSTYTLGGEEADELGRRIAVSVKSPAAGGAGAQEMTVPMIVVEEEGQWKIDLPATMERLMGGVGEALGAAAGAMGEVLTAAMAGVGEAVAEGMGGAPAVVKTVARKVAKMEKAAKKAVKKAVKKVKKAGAKKTAKKPAKKVAKKAGKKPVKKVPARKAAVKRKR